MGRLSHSPRCRQAFALQHPGVGESVLGSLHLGCVWLVETPWGNPCHHLDVHWLL